jgi:hypothetical protein
MSRSRYKGAAAKRDSGGFQAIPNAVYESDAFLGLSHYARSLLWDFAFQFKGDNNGRLVCTWDLMSRRGWRSRETLANAKAELLAAQLIAETRKGARPSRASWYGITWLALDAIDGMDIDARVFPRGAYRRLVPIKNTTLITAGGGQEALVPREA